MTAGRKRVVILHVTQGVKGHAGMSPRRNFGRGESQNRVPIKTKPPPWRKKVAEGLQMV